MYSTFGYYAWTLKPYDRLIMININTIPRVFLMAMKMARARERKRDRHTDR
jgi:hypothetical protein